MTRPGGSGAPPVAQTASDEFGDDDPRSLFEPGEVEAALGALPFRSVGGPDFGAVDREYCVDETADFHYPQAGVDLTNGRTAHSPVNFNTRRLGGGGRIAGIEIAVKQSFGSPSAGASARRRTRLTSRSRHDRR